MTLPNKKMFVPKKENINHRGRVVFIGVFFGLFFAVIAGRATYLQVFKSEWLAEKARSQYNKSIISCGKRGTVYDAKNQELAMSIMGYSIGALPNRISDQDKKEVASKLAKVLGMNANALHRKFKESKTFIWVKRKITPHEMAEVRKLDLQGIEYVAEHDRFYPKRELAAHIIGFTDTDGKGIEGVEFQYNNELYAPADKLLVMRDARGRRFNESDGYSKRTQGNNLVLTIDTQIQYFAENALKEAAVNFEAKHGTAIVMNPKTGAVLAMAQYPQFNPNSFASYESDRWRNRAITDSYEPGSTLKVILAAAALETNKVTPDTSFYCENGSYRVGRNRVNDTHPYEWLTVQQIIKYSSNIGSVKISEIIGKNALYEHLLNFGFGRHTGIDCPGESAGILSDCKKWKAIDAGAISFGQGISVSAIQLITAVSAIANGGELMKPHLVKSITAPDGSLVRNIETHSPKRVISVETAEKVKNMMASAVSDGGTGVNAALDKYTVCGKTGTAQKADPQRGYSADRYTSSFIGFAPKTRPEIAILVILDEPKKAHYGGTVAAPAFRKIAHETLNYLNVEPENDNNNIILLAQRFETKREDKR